MLNLQKYFCHYFQEFTICCSPTTTSQGKTAYLDTIHKYLDMHGTVDKNVSIPSYVSNHGIVTGAEVHALLRKSKVCI